MKLRKETILTSYFLNSNSGKGKPNDVHAFLNEFRKLSKLEQDELVTLAATELGLSKSEFSSVSETDTTDWDPREMAVLKHAVGDSFCRLHLANLLQGKSAKVRAIAGMILLDIAWSPVPIVSRQMMEKIHAAMQHVVRHETNDNVRIFIRSHMECLSETDQENLCSMPLRNTRPSRN